MNLIFATLLHDVYLRRVPNRPVIKNIITLFVLTAMMLSATPKILLHWSFTHHYHIHHCTGSLKDKTHVEAEWPNCGLDAINAVVPFISQDLPGLGFSDPEYVFSFTGFLLAVSCGRIEFIGSRGPPEA